MDNKFVIFTLMETPIIDSKAGDSASEQLHFCALDAGFPGSSTRAPTLHQLLELYPDVGMGTRSPGGCCGALATPKLRGLITT